MSELPPNIDAILASIRSRMNDDTPAPVELPPEKPYQPETTNGDIGNIVMTNGGQTIDALIRSMLEPMLKAWLDANMPEIVERMAQDEIKRLTGRD
jgi:hypothetical protein